MARQVDSARTAQKWARVTPTRTQDYVEGVQAPAVDWQQATSAAQGNYEQGVQQAIAGKRFGKGVAAAGSGKWQSKALQKGGVRWGPGVQEAAPDYQSGFSPFADVINRTTLPARFPKGDPRNIQRVAAIATALSTAKRGR